MQPQTSYEKRQAMRLLLKQDKLNASKYNSASQCCSSYITFFRKQVETFISYIDAIAPKLPSNNSSTTRAAASKSKLLRSPAAGMVVPFCVSLESHIISEPPSVSLRDQSAELCAT